ncbi:MAG: hypothetical protein LKM36_06080 [Flavobacteriales bacterium]|jgi:hypothetical protein|nr:hypothetical protein [Flavobacteriales bacterium]
MIRAITIALTLLFAGSLCAQGIYGRKKPEIFPTDGKMRRGGFYFAPGITYALPRGKDHEEQYFNTPDSSYTALFDPKGKIGLYLEAGWFLSTRDPVILDYWDFGLAYKQLKGTEAFTSTYMRSDTTSLFAGEGAFNDQHLTAHVNANKLIQTRDYQFVQLSLGANLDWRFGTNRSYTADLTALNRWAFPPEFIGQVHVKVGYGFKLTQRLMVIPAIETPVFSIAPEDGGNFGKLQWFSSTYRPLILSVRFLFLRYPKGFACVPVKNNGFEKSKVVNPSYDRK